MNAARAYAKTQNTTASKERMLVLLFEAALRHIRTGAIELEAKQPQKALEPLAKATDIVSELQASLDPNAAPELAATLQPVYMFVWQRLLKASAARDPVAAREAERVFAPICEAFQTAVGQLGAK